MRTVQGLLALARKRTCAKVDRACKTALSFSAFRLKDVKALVDTKQEQTEFEFRARQRPTLVRRPKPPGMSEHAIIRNMNEYGRFVKVAFANGNGEIVSIHATPHAGPLRGATGAGGGSFPNQEGVLP